MNLQKETTSCAAEEKVDGGEKPGGDSPKLGYDNELEELEPTQS